MHPEDYEFWDITVSQIFTVATDDQHTVQLTMNPVQSHD